MIATGRRDPSGQDGEASLAVRAAWLSFVGGLTQEAIAGRLGVSRIKVNRLVALAQKRGMVRTFVDGSIVECVALGAAAWPIATGWLFCEVVPSLDDDELPLAALAAGGARLLMRTLARDDVAVVGVGHGRTLAAMVDALPSLPPTNKRFVSLLGCLTRNAAANPFDVIHRLAEKVGAESYFMPVPFAADSRADKAVLMAQKSVSDVFELARNADLSLVGIGEINNRAHLMQRGMITPEEHRALLAAGAVGEVLGHFLDASAAGRSMPS